MSETVNVTLDDLLRDCRDAYNRMRAGNPHKRLISNCAQVLIQQAQMLVELQARNGVGRLQAEADKPTLVLTDG